MSSLRKIGKIQKKKQWDKHAQRKKKLPQKDIRSDQCRRIFMFVVFVVVIVDEIIVLLNTTNHSRFETKLD